MKYYLVALLDKDSQEIIETMQKSICQKYRLYKNIPMLHITLEILDDPDINYLTEVLSDVLKHYKKFRAEVSGVICFDPPYKSVNLKVENKGYIYRLIKAVNSTLKARGFKVREEIENWDIHISLANTNYAIREWTNNEYNMACETTKDEGFYKLVKIEKVELWKPINNKKEMVVKSFPLRDSSILG
ncbi:MAG TPA: 2'-5' RNA ligase family protein [Clostridiaceae bacterium]